MGTSTRLTEEIAKARERMALVPEWARPVAVPQTPTTPNLNDGHGGTHPDR
jgi:hypothetical protein